MGSDKLLKTTTTSFFPPDNISSPVPFFRKAFTALKPNVITFVKKQESLADTTTMHHQLSPFE